MIDRAVKRLGLGTSEGRAAVFRLFSWISTGMLLLGFAIILYLLLR